MCTWCYPSRWPSLGSARVGKPDYRVRSTPRISQERYLLLQHWRGGTLLLDGVCRYYESSRTSLDNGNPLDIGESMGSKSCSNNNTEVNCAAEDTNCSGIHSIVISDIPCCVGWGGESEYAKLSCVEESNGGSDED